MTDVSMLDTLLDVRLQEDDGPQTVKMGDAELRPAAMGEYESERHTVHIGGQHVGDISKSSDSYRDVKPFEARALNGNRVGGRHSSRQGALDALKNHLATAPQRIQARGEKYLVADQPSYSGRKRYTEYSSHDAARDAVGLPPAKPAVVEERTGVALLLDPLAEAGLFDPQLHPRDPLGRWSAKIQTLGREAHAAVSAAHPPAAAFVNEARVAIGPRMSPADHRVARKQLKRAHEMVENAGRFQPASHGHGEALRKIVKLRDALDKRPTEPVPDMHAALRSMVGRAKHESANRKVRAHLGGVLAASELTIAGLVEAFTTTTTTTTKTTKSGSAPTGSSGGFNSSKHARGYHGMFITTGSHGEGVRGIQRKVGAKTDGQYGSKTKAAVEAFQKKHGLTVDGIVGRQTATALAGGKNAAKVKVGALSAAQAKSLGQVRGAASSRAAAKKRAAKRAAGGVLVN